MLGDALAVPHCSLSLRNHSAAISSARKEPCGRDSLVHGTELLLGTSPTARPLVGREWRPGSPYADVVGDNREGLIQVVARCAQRCKPAGVYRARGGPWPSPKTYHGRGRAFRRTVAGAAESLGCIAPTRGPRSARCDSHPQRSVLPSGRCLPNPRYGAGMDLEPTGASRSPPSGPAEMRADVDGNAVELAWRAGLRRWGVPERLLSLGSPESALASRWRSAGLVNPTVAPMQGAGEVSATLPGLHGRAARGLLVRWRRVARAPGAVCLARCAPGLGGLGVMRHGATLAVAMCPVGSVLLGGGRASDVFFLAGGFLRTHQGRSDGVRREPADMACERPSGAGLPKGSVPAGVAGRWA